MRVINTNEYNEYTERNEVFKALMENGETGTTSGADTRQQIVWIPAEKLFPHPDNPRRDLGDLGYEMSDEERALMDGTSDVYYKNNKEDEDDDND